VLAPAHASGGQVRDITRPSAGRLAADELLCSAHERRAARRAARTAVSMAPQDRAWALPRPVHPHHGRPRCAATPAGPAARSSWRAWAWARHRWRGTCPSGRWRRWAASRARSPADSCAPPGRCPRTARLTRPGACTCGLSRLRLGVPGRVHSNKLGLSCVVLGGLGASCLTGRLSCGG